MIDGNNFFDQPVKNYRRSYDNIRKTVTGLGDDSTTGCLPHYVYFQSYYKTIATDLRKQSLPTWPLKSLLTNTFSLVTTLSISS